MFGMDEGYTRTSLAGGLTLLVVPMQGVASVTILAMVRTGSRDEPAQLAGISHFLEHMVFKGTQKYPTAHAVTSTIDAVGGEFNAFTSKEFTGFYIKLAAQHLRKGMDVLSQILTRPKLSPEEIEREKGVIVEEINMYEDLPPRKVADVFEKLIYGDTGLGRETIGTRETVRSLKRRDFLTYLGKRYTNGRMVIGLAGGVADGGWSLAKIEGLVKEAFSELPQGTDGWGLSLDITQQEPALTLVTKETGQAHFVLGVRSFKRGHKDRFALAVLSTILGGSASSRLFTEIRDRRGLAYYVKSDVDTYFDHGSFTVSAGVDIAKLDEAITVTLEEFGRSSLARGKGSITQEEVGRAKEYLKGRFILELEDSEEVADHFVRRFLLERTILTPKQFLGRIDAVIREDVVRVARSIFLTERLNLAVIGPYSESKDGQRLRKLLRI